jgi:quinol monooxygenase YgiN
MSLANNAGCRTTAIEEDLTPARAPSSRTEADEPPATGHVMVTIEYRIDPARADEFRALMQESRRSRLRQGALSWELLRDLGEPGRFVEQIVDESWTDHLRRFDRITAADAALRERKLAFHIGESPPVVTRSVMESTVKGRMRGAIAHTKTPESIACNDHSTRGTGHFSYEISPTSAAAAAQGAWASRTEASSSVNASCT